MRHFLNLFLTLVTFLFAPALATADTLRPAGWQGALLHAKCDPDRYTPIFGKDGKTILYWNNPTCQDVSTDWQEKVGRLTPDAPSADK